MSFLISILAVYSWAAEPTPKFCESFPECRAQFQEQSKPLLQKVAGSRASTEKIDDWKKDEDLGTDIVYLPASDNKKQSCLVVVTSGVHGVEGYTGSYVQSLMLAEQANSILEQGCSLLMVHGINAHGFKHRNRYTERRVDLNRTWFVGEKFPKDLDDGNYDYYDSLFNPKKKAKFGPIDFTLFATLELPWWIRSATNGKLTKAAGIGQYKYPKGIIYGGNDFAPHRTMLSPTLQTYLRQYRRVLGMDIHTGLGRKQMQLLPNPPYNKTIGELRKKVFEVTPEGEKQPRRIEGTGGADFYASHGDFSDYLCQLHAEENKEGSCASMLLEIGTLKPAIWEKSGVFSKITDFGDQAYTLYLTIRENQQHQHGVKNSRDKTEILAAWSDLFYPTEKGWRQMVTKEARALIPKFVEQFLKEVK